MTPQVSVITVCLNSGEDLIRCVQSVVSQCGVDVEIIVKDGMSTDNSIQTLELLAYPNVKIFQQADNGIYDAMNQGIEHATGEVITFLNADDYYYNFNHLRSCYEELVRDNNIKYGFSSVTVVNNFGVVVYSIDARNTQKMFIQNPHPGVFIKSEILKSPKFYFDSELKISADLVQQIALYNSDYSGVILDSNGTAMSNTGVSNSWRGRFAGALEAIQHLVKNFGIIGIFYFALKIYLSLSRRIDKRHAQHPLVNVAPCKPHHNKLSHKE